MASVVEAVGRRFKRFLVQTKIETALAYLWWQQ
jgi:hypothetical protein